MKDLIINITENLTKRYPKVKFKSENEDEIIILPENETGFEIFIQQSDKECTIYYNSWHIHFENTKDGKNELIDYLIPGLSKLGRLKTYLRNGKEYKWKFEILDEQDGKYYSAGTTALINLKFWQKPEIKYFQNDFIDINELQDRSSS